MAKDKQLDKKKNTKTTQKKSSNKPTNKNSKNSNTKSVKKKTPVSKNISSKKQVKKIEKKEVKDVVKNDSKIKKETKINKLKNIKDKFIKKDKVKKERKKISFIKKKENKKKKDKKEFFTKKTIKILLIVLGIICGLIIIVESYLMFDHYMELEKNSVYYDMYNSLSLDDGNIVAVGQSDFKYSHKFDYTKDTIRAKLIKYDKKGKIIFEKMYDRGISTTFNYIITVDDGYLVAGSGIFSKEEEENEAREAFLIKYDRDGNIVWEKFYSVITNTSFTKVISVEDGYIAVGQSIYANMEMGNHSTGGGIIVKYDKNGNEVWHNNHGGTKSAIFNDIVEVNDGYYVVGKDATDFGLLVKYDKSGKYLWHKNYRYTDSIGFTGIAYTDNSLYVVGSKKVLASDIGDDNDRTTDNTDCLLVKYNLDGSINFEKTFGGSKNERYNSILAYHNNLYVVGHINSNDAGLKIATGDKLSTGLIIRYDKDGNILKKEIFGGSKSEVLTSITTDGISIYISGYSNSKDGNIKTSHDNGKDYFGKIIKTDNKFKTMMIK